MIAIFGFFFFCWITGCSCLNGINKKQKLSDLLFLSIPIGLVFHTIVFLILAYANIYYSKYAFIILSILSLLSFLKKRTKIENDLKKIPIYFIIFLAFVIIRLAMMANSGFFDFYNFDEFTAYQTNSTIIYLSHKLDTIYTTYAPLNYLIGTMLIQFVGLSLTASRNVAVVFYGLISLNIYLQLREHKINTHIAALVSMIFLIASSEYLILAKTFYTNIFFMYYFIVGVFGIVDHYIIKEKNKIPWTAFILLLGALLTRRDAMYLVIFALFTVSIIAIIKNLITKKEFIILNSSILFPIVFKIFEKIKGYAFLDGNSYQELSLIDRLCRAFEWPNLKSYLKNLYSQTLATDSYYFNVLMYLIFLVTIVTVIVLFIQKKKKEEKKKYLYASSVILLFEFVYIGIVVLTQIFIFKYSEWLVAASFSRYVNSVIAINFIILVLLLVPSDDKFQNKKQQPRTSQISTNPKILLIVPAYNEEENILRTYQKVMNYNQTHKKNYDIFVINDGSQDATQKILEENHIPHTNLVTNLGIGGAVQTGYQYALEKNYDIAIQFDGDGQHDISYVEKLIDPIIKEEADLVIGSRFLKKHSSDFQSTYIRRFGIHFISFLIRCCTGEKIMDTTSGFRAVNRPIMQMFANDYPMDSPEPASTVAVIKQGYKVKEIAVSMNAREGGSSSITNHFWKPIYYMIHVSLSIMIASLKVGGDS